MRAGSCPIIATSPHQAAFRNRTWALGALLAILPVLARAAGPLPAVTVQSAERTAIVQEVSVTGTVVSPQTSRISPEVAGRIAEMRVEVGDRVERGDVLAFLDEELARLDLARARASTREAREALSDARRRLAEAERLSAGNAFSESALLSLRSEVETDEAALARLGAEEERQKALLKRHEVRAPFAGAISNKLANAGEWVVPGSELVELVAIDELRIDFQVPQELFTRVDADSRVGVTLNAEPDRVLPARILRTVPQSESGARTFLMLVALEDESFPIIPGMSARARLELASGREGVVVPRDALLRHPDGRITVFVLQQDGRVVRSDAGTVPATATVAEQRVVTGRAFEGRVEITEGVEAASWVVVVGNEGLQDGQRVRVQVKPADV